MDNGTAVISCIAAVISVACLLIMTLYQLPQKIVDTFKVEIYRLFYSEPTASIFQWYRKTSNSGTSLIFSEIKGFFPAYLRNRYCEGFFAVAVIEVKLRLGQEEYLQTVNYDESRYPDRIRIFKFIESHKKKFRGSNTR